MKTKFEEIATQIGGKIIEYEEVPAKILRIEDEEHFEIECYDPEYPEIHSCTMPLPIIDLNIEDRNKINNNGYNDELILCVARIEIPDGLIFRVLNIKLATV